VYEIKTVEKPTQLGYSIKQRRSQKTYDALITTGFKLLENKTFESITIAELAREAGYSVGAFYSRFRSKDEYFDSMLQHHMLARLEENRQLLASHKPRQLVTNLISNLVSYYWEHRHFWRAALIRNTQDSNFWAPIRKHGDTTGQYFIDYINERRDAAMSVTEKTNVLFAFQVTRGVINNAILNRPGPVFMGQTQFVDNLTRAFLLVSGYNKLLNLE
jgi:AcrR family transcriptional regulator